MATTVTVATNTAFDVSDLQSALTVTFSNTQAVPYKVNTNVVFACTLSDGTTTINLMFAKLYDTAGSLTAGGTTSFTFDNVTVDTPLTGTITGTNGVIYYTPSSQS